MPTHSQVESSAKLDRTRGLQETVVEDWSVSITESSMSNLLLLAGPLP